MTSLPVYKLTLHKTYYDKGFFNLGVDVDRFVRADSGPVSILLASISTDQSWPNIKGATQGIQPK